MSQIYFANTLSNKYPEFFHRLEAALQKHSVPFALIPHSKDIWARDYMPIAVGEGEWVQFTYTPDYIMQAPKLIPTLPDMEAICASLGISPLKSNIVLDGGNVIRYGNTLVMTDKVYMENKDIEREALQQQLKVLLKAEQLVIVPYDLYDYTGHIDGMLRFVDANTVLVNDYSRLNITLQIRLRNTLRSNGLQCKEMIYAPHPTNYDSAQGAYLNYLQTDMVIFVPIFNIPEDEPALTQLRSIFPHHIIEPIDCREIAPLGGLLNCICWEMSMINF